MFTKNFLLQPNELTIKSYSLTLSLLISISLICLLTACEDALSCDCPIQRPTTYESGNYSKRSSQSNSINSELEIEIPTIKKVIETEVSLGGEYRRGNDQVEQTYFEILGGNPNITQTAGLFWSTACALYEISCMDPTITEQARAIEKRKIVREYEDKISAVLNQDLSDTSINKDQEVMKSRPEVNFPSVLETKQSEKHILSDFEEFDTVKIFKPSSFRVVNVELEEGDALVYDQTNTAIFIRFLHREKNRKLTLVGEDNKCIIQRYFRGFKTVSFTLSDCN